MPAQLSTFHSGEWVMIADEASMQRSLAIYRNRSEVILALLPYIGQRLQIVELSYPHGSGVLYKLKDLEQAVWEECLIDWTIDPSDPNSIRASEAYDLNLEETEGETYLTIRDKQGRLFRQSRHHNPSEALEAIAEIADKRSKIAFEGRFCFDGDWGHGSR